MEQGLILTREQDNQSMVFQPAESSVNELKKETESESVSEVEPAKSVNLQRTKCEVFSRVVGYIRPVGQWNDGKAAEFFQRKTFEAGC